MYIKLTTIDELLTYINQNIDFDYFKEAKTPAEKKSPYITHSFGIGTKPYLEKYLKEIEAEENKKPLQIEIQTNFKGEGATIKINNRTIKIATKSRVLMSGLMETACGRLERVELNLQAWEDYDNYKRALKEDIIECLNEMEAAQGLPLTK